MGSALTCCLVCCCASETVQKEYIRTRIKEEVNERGFCFDGSFRIEHSKFIVQVLLSFTIVIYSFVYIWRNSNKDQTVFVSLITFIVGYWLPSPKIKDVPTKEDREELLPPAWLPFGDEEKGDRADEENGGQGDEEQSDQVEAKKGRYSSLFFRRHKDKKKQAGQRQKDKGNDERNGTTPSPDELRELAQQVPQDKKADEKEKDPGNDERNGTTPSPDQFREAARLILEERNKRR